MFKIWDIDLRELLDNKVDENNLALNCFMVELENDYYILSNDKINIGDWFLCTDRTNYYHIFKCIGLTDDTHLKVSNDNIFGGYKSDEFETYPYSDWDIVYSRKIIATTNKLLV